MKYLFAIFLLGCTTSGADTTPAPTDPVKTSTEGTDSAATVTPTDVLKAITIVYREGTDNSGVADINCLPSEKLVGGGCYCDGMYSDNEAGYLFACIPNDAQTGYTGACYDAADGQTATPIMIRLTCMTTATTSVAAAAPGLPPALNSDDTLAKLRAMRSSVKAR